MRRSHVWPHRRQSARSASKTSAGLGSGGGCGIYGSGI